MRIIKIDFLLVGTIFQSRGAGRAIAVLVLLMVKAVRWARVEESPGSGGSGAR
jgi:hypothetical protein